MEYLPDKLENYILGCIDKEPEYLKQLTRETYATMLYPRMLSGHLQGRILKMLCSMIKPERILEIGTFTGYSALCMAEALSNNGIIDTIEVNDELKHFTQKFLKISGQEHKINLITGDAISIIPDLKNDYDLVFIDGNKRDYLTYYKLALDKIPQGGFIIADNVLWSGKVIEPVAPKDQQTQGIIDFNAFVANDTRVEKVIFPVRDGFTVIRKL